MSRDHHGNTLNAIVYEEHDGESNSKKVIIGPLSFYQNMSLVSGYNFYGVAAPGSSPTFPLFRLQRETRLTGEVLFGNGQATFTNTWSTSSMPSISWS